ncbi:MAG TPA: aspartate aminotransferase family protein [Gemmatimonadales bacterium]|nr:aspartate aminotransferase family protein [Gemmatimonadales bacterium]
MTTTAATELQLPPCPHVPRPYTGPSRDEVLATRKQFANPGIFTVYREPLILVEGHRQYLFDETGRRYLDLFAGIATVACGHAHPTVVRAIEGQLERLGHTSTIYLNPLLGEFAKRLAAKMPAGLEVTYFVNSGSEANDLAILMARLATGNHDVIALRNGYHGGSPAAMALTSPHTWKYPAQLNTGVHHAINPDPYRSPFRGTPEEIASQSAADIRELVRFSTPGRIAAFIAEAYQGVGGVTHGAPNYLREAYAIAREAGGLCIADEVQPGFGRTGDHYWGFENFGVVPDIVTMAKGIGNGFPLAAVTTRRDIAQKLTERSHINTFGGNPLAMAAGLAVLDVIDQERLQENARVVGARLRAGLEDLATRHRLIGDVRGRGLMLGVELVRDRATKEPAREETTELFEQLRQLAVLVGKGGLFGNVLRVKPPLCITAADVDYAIAAMDRALSRVGR